MTPCSPHSMSFQNYNAKIQPLPSNFLRDVEEIEMDIEIGNITQAPFKKYTPL